MEELRKLQLRDVGSPASRSQRQGPRTRNATWFFWTKVVCFPLYSLPTACDPGFQQAGIEKAQLEGREPRWGSL